MDGSPRRALRPALVVAVAVLVGLGLGRFVLAGPDEVPVTTTPVAASADLAERVAQLERAVAGDPRDLGSLQALGTAYVDRAAQTGDAAYYELARDALDRADRVAPGDAGTSLGRGVLALALHDFDTALEQGERALAARPGNAAALAVLVDAHVELGRYDEAERVLSRLLDRDPGLPALARTSYLRELSGDLDGAVEAMRAALAAGSPDSAQLAQVRTLLAGLLLQTGDVDAAAAVLEPALRGGAAPPAARVHAARVRAARGDLAGAAASLEELVAEQPVVDALVLLGRLQSALGGDAAQTVGTVRAIAAVQEAAGQAVDLEMALFETTSGDPARGLELARTASSTRPDNVFAADALGWAALRTGDAGTARDALGRALRLGTPSPSLRWHAAELAAAEGDADAAREHLALVLRAAPWDPAVDGAAVSRLATRLGVDVPAGWS